MYGCSIEQPLHARPHARYGPRHASPPCSKLVLEAPGTKSERAVCSRSIVLAASSETIRTKSSGVRGISPGRRSRVVGVRIALVPPPPTPGVQEATLLQCTGKGVSKVENMSEVDLVRAVSGKG